MRRPISFWRAVARASSRFATFTQPISDTGIGAAQRPLIVEHLLRIQRAQALLQRLVIAGLEKITRYQVKLEGH
jgi:hypothetical protein